MGFRGKVDKHTSPSASYIPKSHSQNHRFSLNNTTTALPDPQESELSALISKCNPEFCTRLLNFSSKVQNSSKSQVTEPSGVTALHSSSMCMCLGSFSATIGHVCCNKIPACVWFLSPACHEVWALGQSPMNLLPHPCTSCHHTAPHATLHPSEIKDRKRLSCWEISTLIYPL